MYAYFIIGQLIQNYFFLNQNVGFFLILKFKFLKLYCFFINLFITCNFNYLTLFFNFNLHPKQ